jgi:mono/diheme cytochrome c family protein
MLQRAGRTRALLIVWACVSLFLARATHPEEPAKQLNPFAGDPEAVKEGRKLFQSYGCPGCHGLMGGGGMGKPLLDDTWIFASDDETLYKLIKGQLDQQLGLDPASGCRAADRRPGQAGVGIHAAKGPA